MANHSLSVRKILAAVAAVGLIASFVTASLPAAHALVSPQAAGSNFNSSFNGSHSGWSPTDAGVWTQDASHYSTLGIATKISSIKHSGSYSNFVFQAKIRRTGCTSCASFLWVRGTPLPLSPFNNAWSSGYAFYYNDTQEFGVAKFAGGLESPVVLPIFNPYINAGSGWNVLKVVFYGPAFLFYINGVLMWAGFDTTYTNGSVGIGMFRNLLSTGNNLVVDWAKLSKIVGDPGPLPTLAPGTSGAPTGGVDPFGLP